MKFQRVVSLLLLAVGVAAIPSPSEPVSTTPPMYYIDDTDPSIIWSVPFLHLNSAFAPITWASTQECYNKTFTVGQGYSYQNRTFTVPFTGSGISLFVAYNNRLGLNVTVTLDDDFTTINWFILDTDTTNSASYTSYNATLYNMQNLDYGDHHVTVELQDYEGNESTIMFDYAAVTGTRPESKAALAAQTRKLRAGLGGGLGVAAAIAALALILLFLRRRSRRKSPALELNMINSGDPFADAAAAQDRDLDAKDASLFRGFSLQKAKDSFRPGHNRRQSSFSQGGTSPISPVTPVYSKYLGGGPKHPWQPLAD